jgi:hypothetical protein
VHRPAVSAPAPPGSIPGDGEIGGALAVTSDRRSDVWKVRGRRRPYGRPDSQTPEATVTDSIINNTDSAVYHPTKQQRTGPAYMRRLPTSVWRRALERRRPRSLSPDPCHGDR